MLPKSVQLEETEVSFSSIHNKLVDNKYPEWK